MSWLSSGEVSVCLGDPVIRCLCLGDPVIRCLCVLVI